MDTFATPLPDDAPQPPPAPVAPSPVAWRRWVLRGIVAIALLVVPPWACPGFAPHCSTVSTDNAYVNGHVTFVAPFGARGYVG
ncbi:MAG TPA: hypothetical protein VKH82_16355 [Candidatus Binatia bacterium]|nr:hypothetical protein [Candidatus Binatia bacterium]